MTPPTPDPEGVEVARITITKLVQDDDITIYADTTPNDVPLVDLLGMLRLTEDTVIRQTMGEDQ